MSKVKDSFLEYVFAGLLFALILLPNFMALYIGITILTVVYAYIKKEIKFHFSIGTIGFVLLYVAYLIGVLWTENPKLANFYVVNKVAFFLFPFLLGIKKKEGFNLNIVLKGLIYATLISFAYGLLLAIPCYWKHFSIQYCFMRSYLYPVLHPTYVTVFVQISMVALFRLYRKKEINRYMFILVLAALLAYNVLLMSLSGILFLLFMVFSYLVWKAWHSFNRILVLIGVPLFLIGFVLFAPKLPILKGEIEESKTAFNIYKESPSDFLKGISSYPSGSDVRLVMWTVAWDEITKHPKGVGTGNVDIYLGKNLRDRGMDKIASYEYNPHNQFLQTTLEIGIVGGILFVLIILFGLIDTVRVRSWILFFLFASLFLNSLFESMLQHQAGIIFYPFIYMMILIDFNSNKRLT